MNVKFDVGTEGIIVGEVGRGEVKWRIIGVYICKQRNRVNDNERGRVDRGKKKGISILVGGF